MTVSTLNKIFASPLSFYKAGKMPVDQVSWTI